MVLYIIHVTHNKLSSLSNGCYGNIYIIHSYIIGYRLSSNSLLNWIKKTLDEQVNEKLKIRKSIIIICIKMATHLSLSLVDPLLSRTTEIDDFTISRTNELYHHFSILADVLIELHSSCPSLSEEELILLFNTSKVYSEVSQYCVCECLSVCYAYLSVMSVCLSVCVSNITNIFLYLLGISNCSLVYGKRITSTCIRFATPISPHQHIIIVPYFRY